MKHRIKIGMYAALVIIVCGATVFFLRPNDSENFHVTDMPSHAPGGLSPGMSFHKNFEIFKQSLDSEKVTDISGDPNSVPNSPQKPDVDGIVRFNLEAHEVISEISPGVHQIFWTYNKQVPGPMLRVREGDMVEVTLKNNESSLHNHNIDLHAVIGPGGGGVLTDVAPGQKKTFRFKALHPGLYVYHCAMQNMSTHNSQGQYGMIMVDPKNARASLSKVDKEFYVMQGEFYTKKSSRTQSVMDFDPLALLNGNPSYIVFNGRVETETRMRARVGDKIRMYVGNGGVNLISSFHIVGEVFSTVYPEAAMGVGSSIFKNVQTTAVLPGGAAIVEFTAMVPGKYVLVDHALARMNKGAWAILEISGKEDGDIFLKVDPK